jgi:hypothetical protein
MIKNELKLGKKIILYPYFVFNFLKTAFKGKGFFGKLNFEIKSII